ncbi:MAG: hypothetical protein ACRCWG_06200 [Sarcina sp.]
MKKSIYEIILENTDDDIVDKERVDEIINPTVEGKIKISAGFLDKFALDASTKEEHSKKILDVVKRIHSGEFDKIDAEKELIRIKFKTLNIMELVILGLSSDNYSVEVYTVFKEIIHHTNNIEVCKFALEMTGVSGLCEELIDDYLLFGQVENFTNSISFIMRIWHKSEKFEEIFFKLLDDSKGWGAVNYTLGIIAVKEYMDDIENQKKILISALNKNPITREICPVLGKSLNLKAILSCEKINKELAYYINELFRSLFYEIEPCGGIFVVTNYQELLTSYIEFLKKTRYDDIKFIGVKNLNFFLFEDLQSLIVSANRCSIDRKLQGIADEIEKIWCQINTLDNFEEVLACGNDYLFECIDYSVRNEVSEEIRVYFEEMYKCEETSNEHKYYLEKFLVKKGSEYIKEVIYLDLVELYGERLTVKLLDYDIGVEKYLNKIDIIPSMLKINSAQVLKKILDDHNPRIRAQGLKVASEIFDNNKEYLDEEIIDIIKQRTNDKVEFIASNAKSICEKTNIEY